MTTIATQNRRPRLDTMVIDTTATLYPANQIAPSHRCTPPVCFLRPRRAFPSPSEHASMQACKDAEGGATPNATRLWFWCHTGVRLTESKDRPPPSDRKI
jgi:hypothetical protein